MPSNNYYKSRKGLSCRLYNNMKANSKRRGKQLPDYDLESFRMWLFNQPNFDKLYFNWGASNYDKNKAVSVDRIDDNIGYIFSNMRLTTWKVNNKKANQDMRVGKLKNGANPQKPVIQYREFSSLMEAERNMDIDHRKLSKVCNEGVKIDGFNWKFKKPKGFNEEELGKVIYKFIESSLEVYNLTCVEGYELTIKDIIIYLSKNDNKRN